MKGPLHQILFIVLLSFAAGNCAPSRETTATRTTRYTTKRIDSFGYEVLPTSGRYYVLQTNDLTIANDPDRMVKKLEDHGIYVIRMWYRPPMKGCVSPGSSGRSRTTYPAIYVVQVVDQEKNLESLGFNEATERPTIPCPYFVVRYARQE